MQRISLHTGWWLGLLATVMLVYLAPDVGFRLPYGVHQWRQCDAFSMALNFRHENSGMGHPALHFLHGSGGGRAAGEFTGIYWLNAQLWKFIGVLPWTMRWANFFCLMGGIWALFEMGKSWLRPQASAGISLLVMASPLLAFYGLNYLTNAAALGFVFISWWSGQRAWKASGWSWHAWTVLALTLALLLRPTMAIGLIPFAVVWWHAPNRFRWALMMGIPVLLTIAWVLWTQHYNAVADSTYYCTTVRPLWGADDIPGIWEAFTGRLLPEWYHPHLRWVVLGWFVILIGSAWLRRGNGAEQNHTEGFVTRALGWSWLGMAGVSVLYVVLWFSNLDVHDYYLLEFQLTVPVFLWWIFHVSKPLVQSRSYGRSVATGIFALLLAFQLLHARERTRMKYGPPTGWLAEQLIPSWERDLYLWFHWDYTNRLESIERITPHLRSLGITREHRVISVPDPSPNITLSLMDVKGYTDLYDEHLTGDGRLEHYVDLGATHLVVNDPEWILAHADSPWLTAPISDFENIRIFNLIASEAHGGLPLSP